MKLLELRFCKEIRVVKISRVFLFDINNYNMLFGGKLMSYIDDIVLIFVVCYCWCEIVMVLMDFVDFLCLIGQQDFVCFEFYVIWVGILFMEVFVKVIKEYLMIGECEFVVMLFLIFVVFDLNGKLVFVLWIVLEIEEEIMFYNMVVQCVGE